jgi:hypothetical protein
MAKYSDQGRIGVVDSRRPELNAVLEFLLEAIEAPAIITLGKRGDIRITRLWMSDTDMVKQRP